MAEDNTNPLITHTGHKLTIKESKFIDEYIKTGNASKSVVEVGYNTKNPRGYAQTLLTKAYVAEEIAYRTAQIHSADIAEAEEVMKYFTKVMRGEEKDQFGLDAPLSERTKCAQELAKRLIDQPQRLQGGEAPKLTITVDWGEEASANVSLDSGESVDTASLEDMFDTKKRDNLE